MSSHVESSGAAVPSDASLEQTLRDIVREAGEDEVTVKKVRTAAEERLDLDPGFFKNHANWNAKSKEVIEDAFNSVASQKSPSPKPTTKNKAPVRQTKPTAKRVSTSKAKPAAKRQKRTVTESEESELSEESEESDFESDEEKPKATRKKTANPTGRSSEQIVVPDSSEAEDEKVEAADGSESEMSVVLDEAPPAKKQRKKSASTDSKTKAQPKAKASKAATKSSKDETPDEAEIKRLQGWLVKCGIRKLWHRELAPFDTPKAKIKHLKDMLKDVGMDGRYSEQKAKTIKERRELAAELDAVKEGAKQWGNDRDGNQGSDSDEADAGPRPQRKAAAAAAVAARFVDFGGEEEEDDDDEDEDDE